MKHLLKLSDLTGEEIMEILDLADQLKAEKKKGNPSRKAERENAGDDF